MKFIDLDRAHH